MSELSISVGQHNAEDGRLISASLLHEMHPSLRCIDICLSSERVRLMTAEHIYVMHTTELTFLSETLSCLKPS